MHEICITYLISPLYNVAEASYPIRRIWLSASRTEDSDGSGSSRAIVDNLQKWEPLTECVFCSTVFAALQGGVPKKCQRLM